MSAAPNIYLDTPDPLSTLLGQLALKAEVYVNGNFCGTWAVDTGGSKRIPFHLIGQGEAWLHLDDTPPQCLKPKDLVVFPHDSHHIISNAEQRPDKSCVNAPMTNDGDSTQMICGFFEFKNPAIFPVLATLDEAVILRASTAHGGVEGLVDRMLSELLANRPGVYAVIDQLAFLIFIEVIRLQVKQGTINKGLLSALFDSRIGLALNAIHQDAGHAWSVEALAETASMSRSSFTDRFTKMVGLSPMKYLTSWRMTRARYLLLSSTLSVAQIAEKTGYDTESAFRKAFKNTLGETPGAVRATAKAKQQAE